MNKLANHTSLKEWASAIESLGSGEQVILIRKGGIADPTFGVEAERFYLYPTYFHQPDAAPDNSTVDITHWCEVVRTWRVRELDALFRLEPHVVFPHDTLIARYSFRADQALHILGVRTMRLAKPTRIAAKPEYAGCRSWVSIDDEIDIDGSVAALSDGALREKLDAIDALLTQ
ncbi:MAG: hypothetical protein JWO97_163 [Acidobacteria bacterium]|nr:hypothetical protein [Acidobacteriota bacterium]